MSTVRNQAELDALSKYAARAGVRRIRQLLSQGEHNPAVQKELAALTGRAGDILTGRNLPHGSQLRVLGAGGEGVAQHVLTSQGMKVLKVHDPTAMAHSSQVIRNKDALVGKQIPGFANIESKHQMPGRVHGQQVPAYMNEYVPGRTLRQTEVDVGRNKEILQRGHEGVGNTELADLNRTNFKVGPTGEVKSIDYMPVAKEDMLPLSQRGRANVLHENINPASPTFQSMNANKPGHVSLEQTLGPNPSWQQYSGALLGRAYKPAPAAAAAQATVRPGAINQAATVRPGSINRAAPSIPKAPSVPNFSMDRTQAQPVPASTMGTDQTIPPPRPSQYAVRPSMMPPM